MHLCLCVSIYKYTLFFRIYSPNFLKISSQPHSNGLEIWGFSMQGKIGTVTA